MTAPGREKKGHQRSRTTVKPEAMWAAGRYAVLAALCVLCYGNSLRGELVHDDVWAIINNPDVRPGSSLRNIFSNDFWGKRMADNTSHKSYRPLCILTFKLNIMFGGMTPLYFHIVNMCLHCVVTCLLMHTCECCVFEDSRLAFVSALLFAVHPVHTEAVSGIVGRADILACLLFLLTFLSYIRSVGVCLCEDALPSTVSVWSLFGSLLLGTCAMLVKETGITVFGVCVLYDALVLCRKPLIYHLPGSRLRDLLYICSPFIKRSCLISAYVIIIMSVRLWLMGESMPLFSEQDNPASFSPHLLTRALTYSYLLSFNAWLLLAPIKLCYDWQVGSIPLLESLGDTRNMATLLLAVVMVALCVHCFFSLQRQESREVCVGILFLVFPFIPASNLFFRVGFVVAERVLYMPSMGYSILVAHGLGRLCSVVGRWGTTVLSVSMLLLLLLFSWKTVQQNHVWLSREALFRCVNITNISGIQTLPHNAKVHYNYANFLKDSGRHQEAIHHYTTALRLYPRHASAMNNLGTLTRNPEEAERYYRKALDINPQHNRALFNLGNLLKSQGKEKEAEALLKDSIRFGPHFADAYSSLASLYAEQKRFHEASEVYQKGIENCPDSSDLHNNYGVFLVDTGEGKLAAAHYQQAVRLKPAHYVAMVNLGRLLRSSNENKEAESWYKRALQVTRKVDILTPLGALYYNTGRYEEALQVYREAVALQPDSTDIWLALAQVLAMAGRTKEAEKMTLDIISREGNCIECYRLLSAIYSKRGNFTEALDALDRALQQNPSDLTVRAELHFSKGNQLREMNQLDRAFESYKLAVELKPDQSQAWMNMGGIQHIKGDYAAARMYYQRALLLSPGSKLLKENLAKLDRLERRLTGGA
ncbi:protein O-mannosyl-transferase TMTC1 isoform X1 [Mastacembelus armatus]|uniref:protein O-mannosyl-transferase TMTC1 isoform X1 n=1 Tax=Mastacembelus armatus TaxID=205130 RepID=UPI000E4589E0|nr:protein O-mannosyl-transferase TMTC1 isoform X1 [Mastacembelus armatus]